MAAIETPAAARPAASAPPAPLALLELRNGSGELAELLAQRAAAGDALNAFLLAAGLRQIAEDVLEADRLRLAEVERVARGAGWDRSAAFARTAAAGLATLPRGLGALRSWDARLGRLVDGLADAVVTGRRAAPLAGEARALAAELPAAALSARTVRLPSCFRGFDQHPDDLARLVDRLRESTPAASAPIAVVGLRTSGSYLAPLAAALLRARGDASAVAITMRPWHPLPAAKRGVLRAVAAAGGLVALTDDPPSSGASLACAAAAIERLGRTRVVLMLALFEEALPATLARWPAVLLPWEEWSVHERLAPGAIAAGFERLRPGARVLSVQRLPLADRPRRGHCAARYRIALDDRPPQDVLVRGAGIGYFGDHVLAVERRLEGWVPEIHGVVDGLVFRRWLPDEQRSEPDAATVARYAAARQRTLAVSVDRAEDLRGEDAVWEVAANLLSQAFGRGWRLARVAALDRAVRELLRVERPSIVDGWMAPDTWFAGPCKIKADERAFSNRNLACYDAAFDVAGAAAWERLDGDELRRAFASEDGESIDDERWLVYNLVAHWAAVRDRRLSPHAARRRSARAVQRYLAARFLDDVTRPCRGPFCAIDVDGVLETDTLGFPAPSPAGALALRALLAHGLRPLLASGRSVSEIAERCDAYGLAGGVAEYGTAIYDARAGEAIALVGADAIAAVGRARACLAARADTEVGADHRWIVRAQQRRSGGPIGMGAVRAALDAAAPVALRVVPGEGQTDLVPASVDKATGLRALLARVGDEAAPALAVGDGPEDLPMLRLALRGIAVANGAAELRRAGVRVVRRPYQAGLALAVEQAIGHAPGACAMCRPPPRSPGGDIVLAVLGARERGPAGLLARAVRLSLRHRAHARR
ncbi:MAG TPA: HAD hydrolase family protein [Solirubrobacteraceae bacterium]